MSEDHDEFKQKGKIKTITNKRKKIQKSITKKIKSNQVKSKQTKSLNHVQNTKTIVKPLTIPMKYKAGDNNKEKFW